MKKNNLKTFLQSLRKVGGSVLVWEETLLMFFDTVLKETKKSRYNLFEQKTNAVFH